MSLPQRPELSQHGQQVLTKAAESWLHRVDVWVSPDGGLHRVDVLCDGCCDGCAEEVIA